MSIEGATLREALVCLSGIVYWAGVFVQALRLKLRLGHFPNVRPRGTKERVLWLVWLAVIVSWVGQPIAMRSHGGVWLFSVFGPLAGAWVIGVGGVLVATGHWATYICYRVMGDSWRMGVKERETLELVTVGPYSRVRHPIYTFQAMILLGAAFLLPTPLSLIILAANVVSSNIKAADEERYLLSTHGDLYGDYMQVTGRFIPKPGKSAE